VPFQGTPFFIVAAGCRLPVSSVALKQNPSLLSPWAIPSGACTSINQQGGKALRRPR
jgi:hypothetical protein